MSARRPGGGGGALERVAFWAFLVVVVLPITASLIYALLYTLGLTGLLGRGLTGAFWRQALAGGELWSSLGLSLLVATAVVALSTAGGLALALHRPERLRRGVLAGLLHLPLALPFSVAGFATLMTLSPTGLLSRGAWALGLVDQPAAFPVLTSDRYGIGIVAAHVLVALPFLALLFAELHGSERVDAFVALARSLGATVAQARRRVAIPILLRGARTSLLLLFVVVLGSFEIPLLLGRQAPQLLSVLTYRKWQRFDILQKPEAFAVALCYGALAGAVLLLALRRRGEAGEE